MLLLKYMKGTLKPKRVLIFCCECVYDKGKIFAEFPEDREVYKKQLLTSIKALKRKDFDVLIISGSYTKKEIKKSEAQGMLDWAKDLGLDLNGLIKQRKVILEEYAKDSFENLLFSVCRFYQVFKVFPKEVSVISWRFKENRIKTIAKALKLPKFRYLNVGIKKSQDSISNHFFKNDRLQRGVFFLKKRHKRNPWKRKGPYEKIPRFKGMFKILSKMERERNLSFPVNFKFLWER